ncbi:MAG: hypothetical protein U5L09_07540 [Bacteroidales bacterium]|nr:hypothetical protein [Bacteroidales bacterium]
MAIPYFQKLQREGESGRNQIDQDYALPYGSGYRAFQAPGYLANLVRQLPPASYYSVEIQRNKSNNAFLDFFQDRVILVSGTMFVMWLGERICRDEGIGNGISLIIVIRIIARLPFALLRAIRFPVLEETGWGSRDNCPRDTPYW